MKKAALKVNETRLVKNLRFAFTNKSTVLSELMQNGRRAGATEIHFDFVESDTPTLTVTDNGRGVEDMQNMLTIAESGWDQETKENEHPFGMGFMSAIFAASHVTIESRGKKMEFDTEHALSFGEVDIVTSDFIGGTRITMRNFGMLLGEIDRSLTRFAKAFPISVFLNGKLYDAPRSEQALQDLIDIPGIGKVQLGATNDMCVYLQGLPVKMSRYENCATIVHLDSKLFTAKMPDRNVLIDEGEQIDKISTAIREQWRSIMQAKKANMNATAFVDAYWHIAKSFGILDVMNDVPVIAAGALRTIEEPTQIEWNHRLSGTKKAITQAEVESGEVVLCQNSASYMEGKNMVTTVFAHKQGWLEVETLPAGHWSQVHVRNIEEIEPELQYEAKAQDGFGGCYVSADLIVCDEYRIKVCGDVITVDDLAVAFGEDNHDCTIIVPRNSNGTEALEMASDYTGEYDEYKEYSHEEDKEAISNQVSILRGESPCTTLAKVLSEGNIADCRNVLGGLYVVQARADTSWSSKDYVVDASSIMDALKAAESVLAKLEGNDDGALEKVRNAVAQMMGMQKNAILDLAKSSIAFEQRGNHELVSFVSSRFEAEIANGNHTIQTVAATADSAIEAFESKQIK
jgi:hypothetical protein